MSEHERFPELTDDEPGDVGHNASGPARRTPGKGGFARLLGIGTLLLLLGLSGARHLAALRAARAGHGDCERA